jgi:hypothetical protein
MEFVTNTSTNVSAIKDFLDNFVKLKIVHLSVLKMEVNAITAIAIVLTGFKVTIVNLKYHTLVDMDAITMDFV